VLEFVLVTDLNTNGKVSLPEMLFLIVGAENNFSDFLSINVDFVIELGFQDGRYESAWWRPMSSKVDNDEFTIILEAVVPVSEGSLLEVIFRFPVSSLGSDEGFTENSLKLSSVDSGHI
jgi:hypothetical protein